MLKKFIGKITIRIAKIYAASWVGKYFANRAAAKEAATVVKETKDVVTDVIEEARKRAADAMAGRGVYASYTDAERQAEFDTMFDRVLQMTEMQNKLAQDAAAK